MTDDTEIFYTFRKLQEIFTHDITFCNEAYKDLINEKKPYIDLNISARGCYNDGTYPLYAIMALSVRGFDIEYHSAFVPETYDENHAIRACYINSFIRVTNKGRIPSIKPVYCTFPEKPDGPLLTKEYAEEYVKRINNWRFGVSE